ncbi:hypothetical protein HMPREF1978_01675 [Actinomyces graevenitzii F0530]|uniref:Uncharacterized protein n=1 Tax=Actinomyces graevenitzii F0530 TaxID=1321817 RepID=U1R476_9ACTO|nr:hypothetical protein HMPREF1978_01675 [Actinomyces graevenitzii F0530]
MVLCAFVCGFGFDGACVVCMRGLDGVCGPCRKGAGGARGACGGNADGAHVGWPQKHGPAQNRPARCEWLKQSVP